MERSIFDAQSSKHNILCLGKPDEFLSQVLAELPSLLQRELCVHYFEAKGLPPIELVRLADFVLICEGGLASSELYSYLLKENQLLIFYSSCKAWEAPSFAALALSCGEKERVLALFALFLENRSLRRVLIERQFSSPLPFRIQIEGSFDSSYSLAIVNREMALALEKILPGSVSLFSTDGYGDFPPNPEFLKAYPEVAKLHSRSEKGYHYEVVLRNPFPPRVADMKGLVNGTTSYGWEESEYPKEYLSDLNFALDFLAVMSPYVAKIMRDNGFVKPIFVVGLGGDHIFRVSAKPYPLKSKKRFRFLHISSCFPRKGIDVLLSAYVKKFSAKDDCVLIIKTFPNPHHQIEKTIEEYLSLREDPPEIELINEDIAESQIRWLLETSDVVVLPSRGEGFLLPALEAMFLKKPVVTTAFGGQSFFCTEETSFLIPFRLSWAKTHLSSPYSYWAEPEGEALGKVLRLLYETPQDAPLIRDKVERAYQLVSQNFTWERCAKRLIEAIEKTRSFPCFQRLPVKVAWVSSWNIRCGLSYYSKHYIEHFSPDLEVKVFSQRVALSELLDPEAEKKAIRLFDAPLRSEGEVETLFKAILHFGARAVVLQHHYAYFQTGAFLSLLERLYSEGIKVFLFIHSRASIPSEELFSFREVLAKAYRIVVHSLEELNRLTALSLWERALLLPIPVPYGRSSEEERALLRKRFRLEKKFVLGTFGFLRLHKGIYTLLCVFSELIREFSNLHLLLVTPLYPSEDSQREYERVRDFMEREGLSNAVTLITRSLSDEELPLYLSLFDLGVFPYEDIPDSSSSAVKAVIGVEVPVLCTPAKIFEDLAEVAFFTEDFSPTSLKRALGRLLQNPSLLEEKRGLIKTWAKTIAQPLLSQRLENIIKSAVFYD